MSRVVAQSGEWRTPAGVTVYSAPDGTVDEILGSHQVHVEQLTASRIMLQVGDLCVFVRASEQRCVMELGWVEDSGQGQHGTPDGRPLTTRQAAEVLGITPQGVRAMLTTGRLVGQRAGRDWLIDPASVELRLQSPIKRRRRPT